MRIIQIRADEDIASFLEDNKGIGRERIREHFGFGDRQARVWAAIGHMMHEALDHADEIEYIRDNNKKVVKQYRDDSGSVEVSGKDLAEEFEFDDDKLIDRALNIAGVDSQKWAIKEAQVGFHEVTLKPKKQIGEKEGKPIYEDKIVKVINWNVRVKLKPNQDKPLIQAIEKLLDKIPVVQPISFPSLPKDDNYALELIPADPHFWKLARHKECLAGDQDIDSISNVYIEKNLINLQKAQRDNLSKIFFVVGNDLLHAENYRAITPKGGHHLDIDNSVGLSDAIDICFESVFQIVRAGLEIAPMHIIRISGNHDETAAMWIVKMLEQRFHNTRHITFENDDSTRKRIVWGQTLIQLLHNAVKSRKSRAINSLPQDYPKEWGNSRFREVHGAHLHKEEVEMCTVGGVRYRQVPGLCTNDRWHSDELWIDSVPACTSYLLHKQRGVITRYSEDIDWRNLKC